MRRLLLLPLLLVATSADAIPFDELDANGDGAVSKEEFVESRLFQRWDNDDDGRIAADELNSDLALLTAWDRDGSQALDQEEFAAGVWDQVDLNRDERVAPEEYRDDAGWFQR